MNHTSTTTASPGLSEEDAQFLLTTYSVVIPIMLSLCLLSALCNLVVLLSLRWLRRTMSPTLCFSVSLAVADALVSLLVGVGLVLNSYLPVVHGIRAKSQCPALTLEAFRLGSIIVSILHLLALAVNHYVGIVRPLHYAATVTRRTAYLTLVAVWLAPFAFFLFYFASVPGQGFLSDRCIDLTFMGRPTFRLMVSFLFFTPLISMTAMYVRIFLVVRQHQRGLVEYPLSSHQLQKNVKAVVTTLLILGTYLVGLMPAVLTFALTCKECLVPYTSLSPLVVTSMTVNTLVILKALINPAIYAARMPEVRGALNLTRSWLTGAPCVYPESLLTRTETVTSSLRMYSIRNGRRLATGNPLYLGNHRAGTPSSSCSGASNQRTVSSADRTQQDRSQREDLLPSNFVNVMF